MIMFLWNLILAMTWIALSNNVTVSGFFIGMFVSFVVLYLARCTTGHLSYFKKSVMWIYFLFYFIRQFLIAVMRVTHDILTPRHRMRPGVLAIPIEAETDLEIHVFANVISLMPGSLTLDVCEDRTCLYVHFLYVDSSDIDSFRYSLKDIEQKILELLR